MARALESRIAKLEKGDRGTEDGGPFYLLWIEPGEDRAMALAAAHRHGSLADVPIYCAEWKAPESFTRRGRILGQRPRSRVANQRRLSEDEVAVLSESSRCGPQGSAWPKLQRRANNHHEKGPAMRGQFAHDTLCKAMVGSEASPCTKRRSLAQVGAPGERLSAGRSMERRAQFRRRSWGKA